ncbi:MAG: hypothetical protein U9R44_06475 [Candidatus Omnitrophota bacterium]|nr:hypothetical protein [Candidatus Omnitrophota bacterium]
MGKVLSEQILASFLDIITPHFPITHFLLFLIIVVTLRVLNANAKRFVFFLTVCLAFVALGIEYAKRAGIMSDTNIALNVELLIAYVLFIGISIILLIRNVFSVRT